MAIQLPNPGLGDGQTGDNEYVMWTKVKDNFNNTTHAANRLVGTAAGNVMEVGAFGLGSGTGLSTNNPYNEATESQLSVNRFMAFNNSMGYPDGLSFVGFGDRRNFFGFTAFGQDPVFITLDNVKAAAGSRNVISYNFWTTKNATKDSNGFLKGASPVVQLYVDRIELNEEAKLQNITFEKLGVGDYLIKGSLGFAQEGWYIETPKDANGNVLVAVVYEQLENNDISVKTYDYMLNKKGRIVPDLETPLDIPETRWIDLRLQALPRDETQPLNANEVTNEPIE